MKWEELKNEQWQMFLGGSITLIDSFGLLNYETFGYVIGGMGLGIYLVGFSKMVADAKKTRRD